MNWTACYALFRKERARFLKVWLQTVLAPVITSLMYLVVFGHVLEGRVDSWLVDDVSDSKCIC